MRILKFALASVLACAVCVARQASPTPQHNDLVVTSSGWFDEAVHTREAATPTSLVLLISQRHEFSGRRVQIRGFLSVDFEDTAIYMTRDAFEDEQVEYAIPVKFSDQQRVQSRRFAGRFVMLDATFVDRMNEDGSVGVLTRVRRLQAFPARRATRGGHPARGKRD